MIFEATTGTTAEWNKGVALFPARVLDFLKETQTKLWGDMQGLHGAGVEPMAMKAALTGKIDVRSNSTSIRP